MASGGFNFSKIKTMNTPDMFPDVAMVIPPKKPDPCPTPYFLVAYWPKGRRWAVFKEMYKSPDSPNAIDEVKYLESCGWTNITWLRLPDLWTILNQMTK